MDSRDRQGLVSIGLLSLAFGLLATILVIYFDRGFVPGDAFTYLAAGERLNAGHPLYSLWPGDRIVDYHPPYWTVPLLSPPFIAVLFRPFALLSDAGAYVWWFGTISVLAATLLALVRRIPIRTSLAVIVLVIPLTYEIGVGNVNAFIIAGTVTIWWATTHRHDRIAGVIAAALVMVKIWPVALVWWLLVQRRITALQAAVVAGAAFAVLSIVGAGLDAHIAYLSVIRDTVTVGASDLSVSGMARFVGVPAGIASYLSWIVFIGGCALAWLLRRRPSVSFMCAIVAMTLGSAVVNINGFAILIAMLAPAAWPVSDAVVAVSPGADLPADADSPKDADPRSARLARGS